MAARTRFRDSANVLRTLTRLRMRDSGGVLRTIQTIKVRDAGNVLRTVFQFLSVALDTYYEYQQDDGMAASGSVVSDTVSSTVTGGTAGYTYQWEYVSGSLAIGINSPTSANTAFSATVSDSNPLTTVFRLVVTDSAGIIAYSPNLTVELQWVDTR